MSKKHMGSGIDDFLKKEGIFEQAQAQAVKEVVILASSAIRDGEKRISYPLREIRSDTDLPVVVQPYDIGIW